MSLRNRARAFTLVELLVVISIIALLIAILLPSLKRARDQAKDAVCRSGLHQLGVANQYYVSDHNDRLMWIGGEGPEGKSAPYKQYWQIFYLWPYLKELKAYDCPLARTVRRNLRPGGPSPIPGGPPGSVTGYRQGDDNLDAQGNPYPSGASQISYYNVRKNDQKFQLAYQERYFPNVDPFSMPSGVIQIAELYTEFWFNDWNEGASLGTVSIPAISGNLINRIPYPEHAVMMTDAIDWNPRHYGGNHFLFLDTHVQHIAAHEYFDPKGPSNTSSEYETTDKDPFGNHPYWAWGLGKKIKGY